MTVGRSTRPGVRAILALGAAVVALVSVGCSTPESGSIEAERPLLTDALAFRDGGPSIRVIGPVDGAIVRSPVEIEVATENLRLGPAGRTRDGHGHFHVMVDKGCIPAGLVIGDDAGTIDVAEGSDAVMLHLSPGPHELCIQVGDGFHVAVDVVDRLHIDVVADPTEEVSE